MVSCKTPQPQRLRRTSRRPTRVSSLVRYVDRIDTLHIVGEVINESYQPGRHISITATFYDSNNSVIGTDY